MHPPARIKGKRQSFPRRDTSDLQAYNGAARTASGRKGLNTYPPSCVHEPGRRNARKESQHETLSFGLGAGRRAGDGDGSRSGRASWRSSMVHCRKDSGRGDHRTSHIRRSGVRLSTAHVCAAVLSPAARGVLSAASAGGLCFAASGLWLPLPAAAIRATSEVRATAPVCAAPEVLTAFAVCAASSEPRSVGRPPL